MWIILAQIAALILGKGIVLISPDLKSLHDHIDSDTSTSSHHERIVAYGLFSLAVLIAEVVVAILVTLGSRYLPQLLGASTILSILYLAGGQGSERKEDGEKPFTLADELKLKFAAGVTICSVATLAALYFIG